MIDLSFALEVGYRRSRRCGTTPAATRSIEEATVTRPGRNAIGVSGIHLGDSIAGKATGQLLGLHAGYRHRVGDER
jgi:hypothetical protein